MLGPILAAWGAVLLGGLLGVRAKAASLPALQRLAAALILVVVLLDLGPEVVEAGWGPVGLFFAAAALPLLWRQRHGRTSEDLTFAALLAHSVLDGVGIAAVEVGIDDHHHPHAIAGLVAHKLPMAAWVMLATRKLGTRQAWVRTLALALAVTIGAASFALIAQDMPTAAHPWITAVAGGLMLHLVAHRHPSHA